MKRNLIKSGLVGAFALALSAGTALAQPGNFGGSALQQSSAADGPLVQVRGGHYPGGGGSHGGGFHGGHGGFHGGGFHGGHGGFHGHGHHGGFHGHGRHFRNGFDVFIGPYYDDDYGYDNCRWSRRYHRTICY